MCLLPFAFESRWFNWFSPALSIISFFYFFFSDWRYNKPCHTKKRKIFFICLYVWRKHLFFCTSIEDRPIIGDCCTLGIFCPVWSSSSKKGQTPGRTCSRHNDGLKQMSTNNGLAFCLKMPECVIATLFDWYAHIIWWSTTRRGCCIGSRAIDRRVTFPYEFFSVFGTGTYFGRRIGQSNAHYWKKVSALIFRENDDVIVQL